MFSGTVRENLHTHPTRSSATSSSPSAPAAQTVEVGPDGQRFLVTPGRRPDAARSSSRAAPSIRSLSCAWTKTGG
jgi:hypothetical protein